MIWIIATPPIGCETVAQTSYRRCRVRVVESVRWGVADSRGGHVRCNMLAEVSAGMSGIEIAGDDEGAAGADFEIAGDDVEAPPRPMRATMRDGPLRIFVLVAAVGGMWADLCVGWPQGWEMLPEGAGLVVGAALASWHLAEVGADPLDAGQAAMRQAQRTRAQYIYGHVDYPVRESVAFQTPFQVQLSAEGQRMTQLHNSIVVPRASGECERPFREVLERWKSRSKHSMMFVAMAPSVAKRWCSERGSV